MRSTPERHEGTSPPAVEVALAPCDLVALIEPWPEASLPSGTWGYVLELLDDGTVRVEFIDREAEPIAEATVPLRLLELVWAEDV